MMEKLIYRIGESAPAPLFYFLLQSAISLYAIFYLVFLGLKAFVFLVWAYAKIPYHIIRFIGFLISMCPLLLIFKKN